MVTNLQMLTFFLNLSIKHCLVQFWAKFWASVSIKCMGVLQTFRQSRNESKFQHNFPYFSLNIQLRSLYCNCKCSNMLLWYAVIQITQIQLSTNTHFWVIKWNLTWNFSQAAILNVYNIADTGEKLQQLHWYHPFSDSRDTYLTKNHYESYSPAMVPTSPPGSWTNWRF